MALTAAGCASAPTPYTPNDKLVENIGPTSATQQLREVLRRAIEPKVTTVEIAKDNYTYDYDGEVRVQWHSITSTYENQVEVYFSTIARLDLYEDHQVAVMSNRGTEIDRHRFGSRDDSELFADLVMSFVALAGNWPEDPDSPAPNDPAADPDSVLEGDR